MDINRIFKYWRRKRDELPATPTQIRAFDIIAGIIQDVLFFTALFFYTWFTVRPSLVFGYREFCYLIKKSNCGRSQYFEMPFVPGKPLDGLIAFLMQRSSSDWAGALIITLLAVVLTLSLRALMAQKVSVFWRGLSFFAAILVVVMQQRYVPVPSPSLTSIALCLLFALFYARLPVWNSIIRGAACTLMSIALFLLIGKYWVPFAAFSCISDLYVHRKGRAAIAGIVLSSVVIITGNFVISGKDILQAIVLSFPESDDGFFIKLSFAFLGLLCFAWIGTYITSRLRRKFTEKKIKLPLQSPAAAWLAGTVLLAVFSVAIIRFSFSRDLRTFFSLHAAYNRGCYDGCLEAALKLPRKRFTPFESFCVNTSLFYKGALLENMFEYPQSADALSYRQMYEEHKAATFQRWLNAFKPLFELGLINASEDYCLDLITILSYCPEALKTLAQIQIAKGLPQAGETCLNALAKDIHHGRWAKDRLAALEEDPTAQSDSVIIKARTFWPKHDAIEPLSYFEVYRFNPENRMAFEFFIASLLLEGEIEELVAHVGDFRALGYPRLPKAVQEALIVYSMSTGNDIPLEGYRIDPQIDASFQRFDRIYQESSPDRVAAKEKLAPVLGNTFFFYYVYGYTWRNDRS